MAAKIGGLGKGLGSLMSENAIDDNLTAELRLSEIEPNKNQPRTHFDEEALQELAESIRLHGLLQPIVVRPMVGGTYQIVAGERRWRAARMAGLTEVPVVIIEADDKKAMELALIENLQREDLNPMEEALGFKSLMETYGLTQEEAKNYLLKIVEDEDGNIHALRVGTGIERITSSVTDWVNDYRICIHYGNITSEPFYRDYMGLKNDPETAYHAINSKGDNVIVQEDGWAQEGTEPNYMLLHFLTSCGKAFYGGVGNTLWLDNVRIVMPAQ